MAAHTVVVDRPLLLLDVDGVLNPYGDECPPGFTEHVLFPEEIEPVRVCAGHGAWIAELAGVYEVVWATAWGEEANRLLAPLLGVARLPVVPFPRTPFTADLKVPAIDALAGDRPAAWIDDLLGPAAYDWGARRAAPDAAAAGGPDGRLDPASRREGAGVGRQRGPWADHSIAGQWSMITSSPAASARSAAASSMTSSCSQTALAPAATASSTCPPALSERRNTSTTSTGNGTSASFA